MLTGKYWITPTGVVDVSTSEHALYAKNVMLGLLGTPHEIKLDKTLFDPLPTKIVRAARKRGVDAAIIDHLAKGIDARLFVIERWGWVRTRQNTFYIAKLEPKLLRLVRGAKEYWKLQRAVCADDSVEVHETLTGHCTASRLKDLLGMHWARLLFRNYRQS